MFNLPKAADLKEWQIWHYTKRLKTEKRPAAIKYLQTELLKLTSHAPTRITINIRHIPDYSNHSLLFVSL